MKNDVKITERGWAGHFICVSKCRFRRNTLIEKGRKKIVVSTVGNMQLDGSNAPKAIGAFDRMYETMAFKAVKEGVYWEADVDKEILFQSEWALCEASQSSDNKANAMHDAVVSELSETI